MREMLRQELYWPQMAADDNHIDFKCQSCAQNNIKFHRKCDIQLFSAAEPLKFIGMDILGRFSKMTQQNQNILFITHRF